MSYKLSKNFGAINMGKLSDVKIFELKNEKNLHQ